MNETANRTKPVLVTLFVLVTIGLILFATVRPHTIDQRDLADLWGCYSINGRLQFKLAPDALVTPTSRVAFAARQGRRKAYLDLATPMHLAIRNGVATFEPAPEPTGPIEVHRSSPPGLLLPSERGAPIEVIRTECRS